MWLLLPVNSSIKFCLISSLKQAVMRSHSALFLHFQSDGFPLIRWEGHAVSVELDIFSNIYMAVHQIFSDYQTLSASFLSSKIMLSWCRVKWLCIRCRQIVRGAQSVIAILLKVFIYLFIFIYLFFEGHHIHFSAKVYHNSLLFLSTNRKTK